MAKRPLPTSIGRPCRSDSRACKLHGPAGVGSTWPRAGGGVLVAVWEPTGPGLAREKVRVSRPRVVLQSGHSVAPEELRASEASAQANERALFNAYRTWRPPH